MSEMWQQAGKQLKNTNAYSSYIAKHWRKKCERISFDNIEFVANKADVAGHWGMQQLKLLFEHQIS